LISSILIDDQNQQFIVSDSILDLINFLLECMGAAFWHHVGAAMTQKQSGLNTTDIEMSPEGEP
jgi:hypothetical protein